MVSSSHLLQASIANRVALAWKSKETRKRYGNDVESYVNDSLDILLNMVWKDTEAYREEFFSFDNFRAFALAELSGRVKSNEKQKPILKDGLRELMSRDVPPLTAHLMAMAKNKKGC